MPSNDRNQPPIQSFRDLLVWQEAMTLAETVYRVTSEFPREEIYGITSQMRRAADIAEGRNRSSRGEFLQFLGHSRGSLAELETQIILATRLGYLAKDEFDSLMAMTHEVGRLLGGLRRSLKRPDP